MALTIAVGFVVDDAIVMLENIYRHIEAGLSPLQATLKGARGDRLHHHVDQHLAGRGVHPAAADGRHHRPAVPRIRRHRDHDHRGVGVRRPDALPDDVRAVPARRETREARQAYMAIERAFDRLLAAYTRGLDFVLDHQRATLVVFLLTVAATVVLYIEIPKGFFPQQDTGIILGLSDAPQDISFDEMVRRQHALTDVVARDPDVASYGTGLGGNRPINNGFLVIGLKPRDRAQRQRRSDHHPPAAADRAGAGRDAVPAGGAGPQRRRPPRAHAVPIHPAGFGHRRAQRVGAASCSPRCRSCRCCATSPPISRRAAAWWRSIIDRDQAARFGIQPAADRPDALRCLRPAPGGAVLHPGQQLPRGSRDHALAAGRSGLAAKALPEIAAHRADGAALDVDEIRHPARDLPVDQPSGAVSGGHAVVQSRTRRRARRCGRCDQPGDGRHAPAGDHHRHLPGHGTGVSELPEDATVSDSGGAGGGLHHSRHALRELHSSAHHSLDAAVGRRGRAADAAAVSHRSLGDRADRHHSADRHRQEERHHDGRLRHSGRARAASVAARRDPPGLPAALSADHDDHHGGAARRLCR